MAILAGDLRHRITIESVTRTDDGGGGFTEAWGTHAAVWSQVEEEFGREQYAGMQVEGSLDARVTIRKLGTVTNKMRVLYGVRVLAIRAVIRDQRGEAMVLLCHEEDGEEGV